MLEIEETPLCFCLLFVHYRELCVSFFLFFFNNIFFITYQKKKKRGELGSEGSGIEPSTNPNLFFAESALVIDLLQCG